MTKRERQMKAELVRLYEVVARRFNTWSDKGEKHRERRYKNAAERLEKYRTYIGERIAA